MFHVIGLFGVLIIVGCAHSLMRGTVAMKVDAQEAHVCLGDHEVKVGDRVVLYDNRCKRPEARPYRPSPTHYWDSNYCKKIKLGEGVVTQTLDEHYSVIKIDPGVEFKEGTVVEKYN